MRLIAPKKKVFWITVIVAAVGVVGFIVGLFISPLISYIAAGVILVAYVLLALSTMLKGF